MDIQEAKQFSPEKEKILSDSEISGIKSKLVQKYHSQNDWDYIKNLLKDKDLFTVRSMDESRLGRFSIEGILYDKDALQVFTNLEDCEEYARRYAAVRIGRDYTIGTIPYERVLQVAEGHEKDVYIDIRQERDDRFLVYAGKTKTLHLCINHI